MKGPKGPEVPVRVEDKKVKKRSWLKNMLYLFMLSVLSFGVGALIQHDLDKRRLKPEVKIEIQEKEVVTFVEKSKTETKDFLIHLNPDVDPFIAEIVADAVDKSSEKYRLPRKLVCAIIRKESNVDPFAKSSAGAIGLMQIMPKIHKEKADGRNMWHIHANVDIGCQIFREYLDMEKGNMKKTFHRYLSKNASQVQVEKYSGGIYEYWAKLEMFDYLSINERAEQQDKQDNINSHSEKIESQPVELDPQSLLRSPVQR